MKKIKYLLLILLLILIEPLRAYGFSYNISFLDLSGDDHSEESGDGKTHENISLGKDPKDSKISYNCSYAYALVGSQSMEINMYDINNRKLDDDVSLSLIAPVQAGTSIGMYIVESKTIGYTISESDIKVTKTVEKENKTEEKICTYAGGPECKSQTVDKNSSCPGMVIMGNTNCYNTGNSIKTTINGTTPETYEIKSGEYVDKCRSKAINAAAAAANNYKGNSYKTALTNSNDIKNAEKDEINNIVTTYVGGKSTFNTSKLSDSITINYSYNMSKVCINVKTAKITYKTTTQECSADEVLISDDKIGGKNHWHYFIPLNSKSDDIIEIEFSKATDETISAKKCKKIIDNYKNNKKYLDVIAPLSNQKYNGNSANDKLITENAGGCRLVSIIKIPVKQAFYYEEELTKDDGTKQLTLQGNKFYFRRIDIQKPFNYKITDPNSLWYDWYNANYDSENEYSMNKVKPNISASFNKVLYYTQNNNIRDIRKYNSIMKYYDWTEMKKNGESCLISDQNGGTNCDSNTAQGLSIAKRNFNSGDDGTPYKLGHGPESIICTEGDKEVAYIGAKECKNAG